jgi:protein NrfC
MAEEEKKEPRVISRRRFLFGSGMVVGGAVAAGVVGSTLSPTTAEADGAVSTVAPAAIQQPVVAPQSACATYAPSSAYLVVDSKKCAGCQTCMLACSMVHEGVANPSLSRIQVVQSAFPSFPNDLQINQCRQCTTPLCVQNCPTGACHVDAANGNVRVIDQAVCIGCQTCLSSCPHPPHRTVWNPVAKKSSKCDLCANAPFWKEAGGPDGKQACVSVCTMGALSVVKEVPSQLDSSGYDVNLRTS